MSIIAIIGNKGGVGKTTLAINLATLLSEQAATCLLDADPQGSILHWAAMVDNANMPAVFDATANVGNAVAQYRDDYQHILIDCPPQLQSEQTQAALASADVVVIPVLPSPLDLWATVAVNEGIASARESNSQGTLGDQPDGAEHQTLQADSGCYLGTGDTRCHHPEPARGLPCQCFTRQKCQPNGAY